MKRYLLIGLLPLLGILMTGCHDDEKEEDMIVGGDSTKIVFNEQGEPRYSSYLRLSEQFLDSHFGKVSRLTGFYYILSDGEVDTSAGGPNTLYGISDPWLYLKDKETLVIFNLNDKTVNQSVRMKVSYDWKSGIITSDGRFVAQLRITMADPTQFRKGIFYYGEQNGKAVYVSVSLDYFMDKNYFTGLDDL